MSYIQQDDEFVNFPYKQYICDTYAELADLPVYIMGSVAYVKETETSYILDGNGTWHPYSTGGSAQVTGAAMRAAMVDTDTVSATVNQQGFLELTASGTGGEWGEITGDLSDQTDLQSALDDKQDALVSGTNIKTINGTSVLGSGDIQISGTSSWGNITGTLSNQTDLQTVLNSKADRNNNEQTVFLQDLYYDENDSPTKLEAITNNLIRILWEAN